MLKYSLFIVCHQVKRLNKCINWPSVLGKTPTAPATGFGMTIAADPKGEESFNSLTWKSKKI